MRTATAALIGAANAGLVLPALLLGTYELVLEPSSIVASAGVVSSWQDRSGHNRHATPSGSPAIASSGIRGVVLDGVNDLLSGSITLSRDVPISMYILETPQTQSSARYSILTLSDNGADDRCSAATMVFTNRVAHDPGDDNGNAGWVDTDTALVCNRYDFAANFRGVLENGIPRTGNAVPLTASRVPSSYRLGGSYANSAFYKSIVHTTLIVKWNTGTYGSPAQELEREAVEAAILRLGVLARPQRWPLTDANIGSDDPRILFPDPAKALIDVVVGTPLHIQKDTVHCVSSSSQATRDGRTTQVLSSTAPQVTITEYVDRWIVDVSTAGSYSLTLTEGAFNKTATLNAVAALGGGAAARWIVLLGDSNTARGWWTQYVGDALVGKATMLGTRGPNIGYNYKHQGQDGHSFESYDSGGTVQGTTSALWTGGVLDIPAWFTAMGGVAPDFIVWCFGSNFQGGTPNDGNLEASIDTEFAHAETLLAACSSAAPGISQLLVSPPPGNGDPVVWGNEGSRCGRRRNSHRFTERLYSQFGGRTSEGLYVIPMTFRFDPWRGYPGNGFGGADALHINAHGHEQISRVLLAALTGKWNTTTVLRPVSATVSALASSKLTVVWPEAVTVPNVTGVSLLFSNGTTRTITSVDSGSGTSTTVYNLSGPIAATDVFTFVIAATRTITAVTGGRKPATGYKAVSLTNYDAVPIVLGASAWYRTSDAGASVTLAGSSPVVVAQWSDSIGAYHVAEASARPSYLADFGDTKPAIDFLASGVKHLETATLPVDILSDFTIVLLVRYPSGTSGYPLSITYTGDNGQLGISIRVLSNTCNCLFRIAGNGSGDATATAPASSCPVDSWNVVIVRRTGNTLKVRSNASADGTATIAGSPSSAVNVMTMGGYKIQAGYGDSPDLKREVGCFQRYLSDAECAAYRAYLQATYPNVA